jgi:hypothetical protein
MDTMTRHLIADILGVAPITVTPDEGFSYGIGWMDEGASCVWWRGYRASVPPAAPSDDWPVSLPDLVTGDEG